jgi:hypothetical protein
LNKALRVVELAKIVQSEGYDMTDFGIFDDRAATLWRKPYLDGAVRELTSGNHKSVEQLRLTVEQMILAKKGRLAHVRPPICGKRESDHRNSPIY